MPRIYTLLCSLLAMTVALVAPPGDPVASAEAMPPAAAPADLQNRTDAYGAFLDAQSALSQGDEPEARALLERVVELDPGAAAAHALLARLCLRDGDVACAVENGRQAVAIAPDDADGHKVLAEIALGAYRQRRQAADLTTGLGHLERAARAEPRDPSIWIAWIRVLGGEGRLDEAEKVTREASSVPGVDASAPVMAFVRMLVAQGEDERAIRVLGDVDLAGRAEVPLLELLAELNAARGDWAEQADALTRLRAHRPADPKLAQALGRAHLEAGDAIAAVEPLESALSLRPDDAETSLDLARALVTIGRGGEASALLAALPDAFRNRPPVLHLWSRAAEQAGLHGEAARHLEALLPKLDPEQGGAIAPALRFRAAESWLAAGAGQDALRMLEGLPEDAVVTRLRVQALDALGRGEEAAFLIRTHRQANPGDAGFAALEAEHALLLQGEDAALAVALTAARASASKPRFATAIATWLSGWGRAVFAARLIDASGLVDGIDAEVMRGRASVLYAAGRLGEAEAAYRELLQVAPDDHTTLNDLGYLLAESGRGIDEAVSMIERALRARPDEPAYLDSLGFALHRQGRSKDALPLLLEAARLAGPSQQADIREHLGDVHFALGDPARARAEWEASLRLGNTQPERVLAKLRGESAP